MKKKFISSLVILILIFQFLHWDSQKVYAVSCPDGYVFLKIMPPNVNDKVFIDTNWYTNHGNSSYAGSNINFIAHFYGFRGDICYLQNGSTNGTVEYRYYWNGSNWLSDSGFRMNLTNPAYYITIPNTTPTITSVTVPSYINQSNVSTTPFTINGITDTDAGQTLTYSYSWDGTNWTTIGTESTPKNNTSYSFNLNTTSRPQGNNTLRVKVNDGFVDSSIITSVNIVKDTVSPTLTQVTAVATPTNDNTPNYTFSSTEAGSITYGGSCSSVTTSAVNGNNTITFSTLPEGVFSNCTIRVTDTAGNQSSVLNVASFVVDLTAPVSPNSVIINGGGG